MIIYSPIIGDTIPGFTTQELIIPFRLNPAVSKAEAIAYGFKIKITPYDNINLIINLNTRDVENEIHWEKGIIVFKLQGTVFIPQPQVYYKFQLAYGVEGAPYSSVSIGRCIGEPVTVEINQPNFNIATISEIEVVVTSHVTEPVYQYQFALQNLSTNEYLFDTGKLLHNIDYDKIVNTQRFSTDKIVIKYQIEPKQKYKLFYFFTTINNYSSSKEWELIGATNDPFEFNGTIKADQNAVEAKENGYVQLKLCGIPSEKTLHLAIVRSENEEYWDEIERFTLEPNSDLSNYNWIDRTVEHGKTYMYGLVQLKELNGKYNSGIKKDNYWSQVTVDFEDIFLGDSERQLRIQFNPQVSSFKNIVQEQKIDTIGRRFPFFFRNGNINYKELSISGLLSYLMDTENLFMFQSKDKDNIRVETPVPSFKINNTLKTGKDVIALERQFKLEVLDWLNNGQPKIFRSPKEGNYIIRLMNISLSPNDTLGRMLHTFNATGYEIDEYSINNLIKYNILKTNYSPSDNPNLPVGPYLDINFILDQSELQ